MKAEELKSYEIIEKRKIADIDSMVTLCRHRKTGANVVLISNDDDNKVFSIGFRTTPKDSTGVAHILEHSVLCGSREFPVKDPFIELAKGSLNTFLNAITYPDHTVYPVASCNDKDFQNLMHVYLDAVFYPNIYGNEAIFRQEGWHYELDEKGTLTYNGVVYNEMKGAFSSPDNVLGREITTALYPHTTYSYESGGDPEVIPELSYEQFLDFHRTYYHPSNSYIYLYGNMDMAEKLAFIDEHYLSAFDALEVDSRVTSEPPFTAPVRRVREYPIGEGEKAEENAYLSWSVSVGDTLDRELCTAFQILDFALCAVPGAPLKQALIDKGIGREVLSYYDNGIRQPYFTVISKGTSMDREEEFKGTIRETLSGIVRNGFDKKALLAAINHFEFRYREADFGNIPKGLMYGLQTLESWLYDKDKPFVHIELNETYAALRKKVEEGYFEGLIEKYLLNNPHEAVVILQPRTGLAKEQEEALAAKLAKLRAGMSEAEIAGIHERMNALSDFREREDAPEDLAKIPLLTRGDLKREAAPLVNEERVLGGIPALYHNVFTNGICYLRLMFRIQDVPREYFPYIGILQNAFCHVNTKRHTYAELSNEIHLATGDISVTCSNYANVLDTDQYTLTMEVCTRALYNKLGRAMELMEELILESDFSDDKRLKEILAENNSRYQEYILEAGNSVAMTRALSYGSVRHAVNDELNGVAQYHLTSELEKKYEEKKEILKKRLEALCRMIFRPENLMVDFTGDENAFRSLEQGVASLREKLYTCEVERGKYEPVLSRKNEGFVTPGQVQYVFRAGNFLKKGLPYRGALKVLGVMMDYEYLWVNIRVKGGAYGCMCAFGRNGDSFFGSYRDPNLGQTIDVYEKAADYIAAFDAGERAMTQYIIGAFSQMDMPLTAAGKGRRSKDAYMHGLTMEMIQKERDEVVNATPEDIRGLADYIRAFLADDCLCVVGSEQKIRAEEKQFLNVENLF